MSRSLAIFDLDGTITRGDTLIAFLGHVLSHRPQRLLDCLGLPTRFLQFTCGGVTRDTIKQDILTAIMGGCCRDEVGRLAAAFIDLRFPAMAKRKAVERIQWHRRQGHLLLLATGSLDLYSAAIGDLLGFHRVLATRAAWIEDRISGGFEGENLRGEAKLASVKRALSLFDEKPSRIVAYSDHHSDLPLLSFADEGIAVDPTSMLARVAKIKGFSVERWNDLHRFRRSPFDRGVPQASRARS